MTYNRLRERLRRGFVPGVKLVALAAWPIFSPALSTRAPAAEERPSRPRVPGPNAPAAGAQPAATAGRVNRTLPKVRPPKTTLEFSAQPTTEEISGARVFQVSLVPIGGEPDAEENAALAAALLGYAKRSGPDDFASLTGFLEEHPHSPWRAALLTDLGLEYYNTAHYSLALEAWQEAWSLGQKATDARGKFLADRAACELAGLYSRLGRVTELEALLKSVERRGFIGGATERINMAREALSSIKHRPEVSFRCGPLALQSIKRSLNPQAPVEAKIFNFASTQRGVSLPQVAELSKRVGLNYQMAFRLNASSQGDYTKAKVFHWLHTADLASTAGILESTKEPLEGRVWYDYAGGGGAVVGTTDQRTRIGRVLEWRDDFMVRRRSPRCDQRCRHHQSPGSVVSRRERGGRLPGWRHRVRTVRQRRRLSQGRRHRASDH